MKDDFTVAYQTRQISQKKQQITALSFGLLEYVLLRRWDGDLNFTFAFEVAQLNQDE